MKIDLTEFLRQLHPLNPYSAKGILSALPWGHIRLKKIIRGMLAELSASFPDEPDCALGEYFGCRWLCAVAAEPLDLKTPMIDISTHALGQALRRSSPQVAGKFFLLELIKIDRELIPTLVTGVAMWQPVLCQRMCHYCITYDIDLYRRPCG